MTNSLVSTLQFLPPIVVFGVLVFACYTFYRNYVLKARELASTLEWIKETVLTMRTGSSVSRKAALNKVFHNTILEENWNEFSRTLHKQRQDDQSSSEKVIHRITVSAHHFFTATTIIDKPLKVNYFKHLPGILTGIGIIGTFAGLLFGLSSFDASSPEVINRSVNLLLSGVRDAFFASVFAITAAMVVTHIEKLMYQRCLILLEDLNEAINRMFESGVQEDYLATIAMRLDGMSIDKDIVQVSCNYIAEKIAFELRECNRTLLENLIEKLTHGFEKSSQSLAMQFDSSLQRQVRSELESMSMKIMRSLKGQDEISNERIARLIIQQKRESASENSSVVKAVKG